jgi:putative glycosyltransferase (TIGR04372 family)
MLIKKIRRQLFQLRHGNFLVFLKKFSKFRALTTFASTYSFANFRFRRKLNEISENFVNASERNIDLSTEGKSEVTKIEEILISSRKFIKDYKTSDAVNILTQSSVLFPKSIELKQSLAQVHFVRGEWQKYLSVSSQADELMKQIAQYQSLDTTRSRFLGNDWTGPLGHISLLDTVIKLSELGLSSDEQRVLLYDPRYSANSALLKLFVPKIANIRSDRKSIELFAKKFNSIVDQVPMYRLKSGVVDQWSAIDIANQTWSDECREPVIKLSDSIETRGMSILKRWGLPSDAWFVIIHVREGDHRAHARLQNAEISTYFPMFNEIIRRGGWVIRMGSPLMSPLPEMQNVIDYAHAVERVDWMDVFLWAKAKFSIATNSGGSEVPMCFGTPVIRTNYSSFGHCSFFEKSFMVPKLYKLKGDKAPMSLQQALRTPIPWCESTVHENIEFEIIDNSPQDLVNAAVEMFSRFDKSDWNMTDQQSNAQNIRLSEGAVGGLPISQSFLDNHQFFVKA